MPAQPATPKIALIAARAANGVIGRGAELPWRLPADLEYFYRKTAGSPCIIGRKAFAGVPKKKFLAGRIVIVLTRDPTFEHPGVSTAHSVEEALQLASYSGSTIWICGGGEIYRLFWSLASRIYLTEVAATPAGDATFPELGQEWIETLRATHPADSEHAHSFDFVVYERAES